MFKQTSGKKIQDITPLPPKNSRIGEEKESNEHVKQQHTTTKAGKKINNVKDHYFT